ncbi:hypothetical protein CR152_13490 [Massilia violaceinigra]|uniref:DprA winged helix domain-containing protein n=1 Tax=Massilia violaceinigra TaxID=2045208 RepID=A0A2D2DKB4_9BURK|nr:hypothetical protein [Massilia violaceinigra]ATQ75420.1 hypothetical protein CR152_13490 [Massilia violaceinigra]
MKRVLVDQLRAHILAALTHGPTQVAPLAQRLGVDAEQVRQQCLELFREGAVERDPRTRRARMVYRAANLPDSSEPERDPHPIQRLLAAEWKGHPYRDPLVAALFGPTGRGHGAGHGFLQHGQ